MNIIKLLTLLLFTISTTCFAQANNIDLLLEKVNQAKDQKEKTQLINKLKEELAKKNKKIQEEASAILKAKEKIPTSKYKDPSLN